MQWDASPHAGFTKGEPWLPVAPHAPNETVEAQKSDPRSLLNLYRTLIALRRSEIALTEGTIEDVRAEGTVLTYRRCLGTRRLRVALNLGHQSASVRTGEKGRLLLTTELDGADVAAGPVLELRPDEGVLVELD